MCIKTSNDKREDFLEEEKKKSHTIPSEEADDSGSIYKKSEFSSQPTPILSHR
ncbi:hypothetical protein Hanom_Chr04g00376081 [Helianthus anomalus]